MCPDGHPLDADLQLKQMYFNQPRPHGEGVDHAIPAATSLVLLYEVRPIPEYAQQQARAVGSTSQCTLAL